MAAGTGAGAEASANGAAHTAVIERESVPILKLTDFYTVHVTHILCSVV